MRTVCNCGACGAKVGVSDPDPLSLNQDSGIQVTMHKDVDGDDVAQWWHPSCRESDVRRQRQRHAGEEPAPVTDWEAAVAAILRGES